MRPRKKVILVKEAQRSNVRTHWSGGQRKGVKILGSNVSGHRSKVIEQESSEMSRLKMRSLRVPGSAYETLNVIVS